MDDSSPCVMASQVANSGVFVEEDFLLNLFNDDISNEETLFSLHDREQIPLLALKKRFINDKRFDYLKGVINIIHRLIRSYDNVVDQWLDFQNEGKHSIVSFMFKIINDYYKRLSLSETVEIADMTFSWYEYCISVMCSFIITLNEEQFSVVEDILFENLFSAKSTCAIMASDILCLLCRTIKSSTFSYDICHVIFLFINEIYVEDVEIKTSSSQSAYLICNLTQEILVNLLNRILVFLDSSEIDDLKQAFPPEEYSFLWKMLTNIKVSSTMQENKENDNEELTYDNLYLMIDLADKRLCNVLVDSFLEVENNEYSSLLYLNLIYKMNAYLSYDQTSKILLKTLAIFSTQNLKFGPEFLYIILRLLNWVSASNNVSYQSEMFQQILHDMITNLYEKSSCFISKQYFFDVLINLSSNEMFEPFVESISDIFKLKRDFKLYLKHIMKEKFMENEERELYVCNILSNSLNNSMEGDIEFEIAFNNVNLVQFEKLNPKRSADYTDEYENCKRIKTEEIVIQDVTFSQNIMDTVASREDKLINQLELYIDHFADIESVSKQTKERLTSLAGNLNTIIDKLSVN